uniref:Uncharacterized protein n=2 Tax=Arion vulgaris TaxID=1028688 RepID=A0A0B6ZKE6_9EUPU
MLVFLFSYKSKMKSMSKQDTEKQKKYGAPKQQRHQSPSPDKEFKPSDEGDKKYSNTKPHRTKSQEKTKKGKENLSKVTTTEHSKKDLNKTKDKKSKTSKSKVSGKYSTTNKTNVYAVDQTQEMVNLSGAPHQMDTDDTLTRESTFSQTTLGLRPTMLQDEPLTMKNQPYNGVSGTQTTANQRLRPEKETWDPIIMEYNPQLELVKLRAGQDELASPTRQSRNIGIMCEQWKSNGRHFQLKASQLCDKIIQELHTEIIKYFEQDRGTLVLDVVSDGSSILVVNICMMQTQVKCLQQEIADDSLLNKMQDMFFSKVNISEFDIRGVNLRIVLDQPELNNVLSELS